MRRAGTALLVAALLAFSLGPFTWTVLTAFKSKAEVLAMPPTYLPRAFTTANLAKTLHGAFPRFVLNSFLVATASTLIALTAAALAAYGLTRLRLRGARALEQFALGFSLFPSVALIVPLFTTAARLHLLNSYVGLAVVHAALHLPAAIWTLSAFFRALPRELDEAARVDGFSSLQVLLRIVLPLSLPALGAAGVLLFISSWNEFLIALTFLQRPEMVTLPVGIARLAGASPYEIPWGRICAAIALSTAPMVVFVLAFQRTIVGGLTAGAVKG